MFFAGSRDLKFVGFPSPTVAFEPLAWCSSTRSTGGFSLVEDDFRSLTPGRMSVSLARFLFRALIAHCDSATGDLEGLPASPASQEARVPVAVSLTSSLSASSCCRRKSRSCSVVSFLTASSLARVDSRTESRKSTSSSSRVRN